MAIAVFGGTFDPPHTAHAMAVLWLLQHPAIDRAIVIPTGRHAFGKEPGASFEHRLEMTRLALRDLPPDRVAVSDIEGRREGTSYMVDTLRELCHEHPGAAFRLVAGTDIIDDLPKWKDGDEVLRLAPLLHLPRIVPGSDNPEHGPRPGALPEISSTLLRGKLANGEDTTGLIPAAVRDYITRNQLYHEK